MFEFISLRGQSGHMHIFTLHAERSRLHTTNLGFFEGDSQKSPNPVIPTYFS